MLPRELSGELVKRRACTPDQTASSRSCLGAGSDRRLVALNAGGASGWGVEMGRICYAWKEVV